MKKKKSPYLELAFSSPFIALPFNYIIMYVYISLIKIKTN